jgi:hypothetical protein
VDGFDFGHTFIFVFSRLFVRSGSRDLQAQLVVFEIPLADFSVSKCSDRSVGHGLLIVTLANGGNKRRAGAWSACSLPSLLRLFEHDQRFKRGQARAHSPA